MTEFCIMKNCGNLRPLNAPYCAKCTAEIDRGSVKITNENVPARRNEDVPLSELYPKYYKAIPKEWDSIDVYGVHYLFKIDDPSGMIQHASKKLLLSGVRTGGKSQRDDVREARDTLNRWLQLN